MTTCSAPAPRQPQDLAALSNFLWSIHSYHSDLIQDLRPDQTLCHYTSLDGALGIIGGSDLWLTNSRFSNDNEELSYGHRLVDTVLEEMAGTATTDAVKSALLTRLSERLAAARSDQVYVCCFCERNNLP